MPIISGPPSAHLRRQATPKIQVYPSGVPARSFKIQLRPTASSAVGSFFVTGQRFPHRCPVQLGPQCIHDQCIQVHAYPTGQDIFRFSAIWPRPLGSKYSDHIGVAVPRHPAKVRRITGAGGLPWGLSCPRPFRHGEPLEVQPKRHVLRVIRLETGALEIERRICRGRRTAGTGTAVAAQTVHPLTRTGHSSSRRRWFFNRQAGRLQDATAADILPFSGVFDCPPSGVLVAACERGLRRHARPQHSLFAIRWPVATQRQPPVGRPKVIFGRVPLKRRDGGLFGVFETHIKVIDVRRSRSCAIGAHVRPRVTDFDRYFDVI